MQIRTICGDLMDVVSPRRRAHLQAAKARLNQLLSEYRDLALLNSIKCPDRILRNLSADELQTLFNDESLLDEWNQAASSVQALQLPEMTGGVNPGDQRAIYYLIRTLRPQRILEIGTHIGCSTLNMALAARPLDGSTICTVDIRDVNDSVKRPWEKAGAQHSPKEMMRRSGCHDLVDFRVSPSLDFLRSVDREAPYDFIFLDGDHSAKTVYEELPAALKCVAENGVILLHDSFPGLQPLWSDDSVIPGVFLASQRLQNEGAAFNVLPLGELPWPTKLNSNVTSLALVTAGDHQ